MTIHSSVRLWRQHIVVGMLLGAAGGAVHAWVSRPAMDALDAPRAGVAVLDGSGRVIAVVVPSGHEESGPTMVLVHDPARLSLAAGRRERVAQH